MAQNATEELERLEHAFDSVKKQLFRRLHDVARDQLFQQAPMVPTSAPYLMLGDGKGRDGSSNGSNGAGKGQNSQTELAEGVPPR